MCSFFTARRIFRVVPRRSLSDSAIRHQLTRVRTTYGVANSGSMPRDHLEALPLDCSSAGMTSRQRTSPGRVDKSLRLRKVGRHGALRLWADQAICCSAGNACRRLRNLFLQGLLPIQHHGKRYGSTLCQRHTDEKTSSLPTNRTLLNASAFLVTTNLAQLPKRGLFGS
jgi:hypothetical protein